ncbi:hypothetical protein M514_11774 [Trichuris suis]|uniref:Uncharacterized protein n=1 Tax=Trichuris suis TaxID=68888 RepID=A0A085MVS3_9BILA|nr:hypothetical protein M514_11774 [Trichuris suis]
MFRKRTVRNLRRKTANSDSSEGERENAESGPTANVPPPVDTIPAPSHVTGSAASLLSFAEDVEEEGCTVKFEKKSKVRRTPKSLLKQESGEMVFTKSYKSKPTKPLESESKEKVETTITQSSNRTEVLVVESDEAVVEVLSEVPSDDDDEEFQDVLIGGRIPDANLIHKARKKRERAREGTALPEVITFKDPDKNRSTRRLVREEDDSESDEERYKFYSRLESKAEEERREVQANFVSVEQDSDEERDDELERWEQEQMRKGVSFQKLAYYKKEISACAGLDSHREDGSKPSGPYSEINEPLPMDLEVDLEQTEAAGSFVSGSRRTKQFPAEFYDDASAIASADDAYHKCMKKVKESLKECEENHQSRLNTLTGLHERLEENEQMETQLSNAKPSLIMQYNFFQRLNVYVNSLLDCLNEKVPKIDILEKEAIDYLQRRSDYFIQRQKVDINDQYDDCMASASGLKAKSTDPEKVMRIAEREARRTRRRLKREKCDSSESHCEGMSSDDEDTSARISEFCSKKDSWAKSAEELFVDVADEYGKFESVCQRFSEWYDKYPVFYREAFVTLCLPKLLSPFIRLEMLGWTPLEVNYKPLDSFHWYQSLLLFGCGSGLPEEHCIVVLIPTVVEKVVCPLLTELVKKVWRPASSSQTELLCSFLRHLFSTYPTLTGESKRTTQLLDAVYNRFEKMLNDEIFLPMFPKDILDVRSTGAFNFSERQFWFSVKCLKNALLLRGVLSDHSVKKLVFDGLLNRHIIARLQSTPAVDMSVWTKTEALCDLIPLEWTNCPINEWSQSRFEPISGLLKKLSKNLNGTKTTGARATQKNVIAYVQSKWADTPLVVEASEFMAHEGDGYFWKFIEVLGKNETDLGSATDEGIYERLIGIAKSVLDSKSRVKLFQFALAIRCHSPSVEMYRQLSLSLSGRPAGHVFVDVHGQLSSNINSLDELLSQAKQRSPAIFSFDHIYATRSNKAKKWTILYANLESNEFIAWHDLLKSRAIKGELNYVFRHLPRVGKGKVPLSGYSVELAIKSTEYKAQDDTKIRSKPTAGANLTDDGDEEEADLDGFNIRLLKLLHPELRDRLDEFKLHLLEADELAPLKVWQLQDLSFQAGQRVLLAAKEDVLHTLQELSQNFPLMARSISLTAVKPEFRSEVETNQEAFSEIGIEPGNSAMFINGLRIDLDEIDIFSLLDKLKKEERLLAGFFDMGFRKETQSLLYRISSETSWSKFALDYTQWLPDFVNDLENDPQYRQWGNSVQLLLQPYFPGMIRPIARNFFTLIFAVQLGDDNARSLLQIAKSLYEHVAPVGLILATNPDKKISGYSDGGVALLNAYNFIKGDTSIERALKFVLHVYNRVPSGNVTPSDVIDVFKQKYPDEDLSNVFDVDSDYNSGRQRWAQFAQNSGLSKLPSVLLNGFPMADNDVTSDQFEEAVVLEVSQVTSELQKDVLEGKLTDGVDVQKFILNKPFVLPKLNPKVLATDNEALILTDVMEYKVRTVDELKELGRKQQNQYIVQSRRYLTKNDESVLRPVTLWVVANVATKDGRDLYLAAIRSLKQLPNERVGLIHNVAPNDRVGYAIASLIQACLKLPLHQAKVIITKMLEKQLKTIDELEKLDIHGVDWSFLRNELTKKGEDIVAIDSYYSTHILNIPSGKVGLIINGIILSDVTSKDFSSTEDFALIEKYLLSSGCKVIASQIRKWNVPHDDGRSSDLVMRVFSLLKAYGPDTKRQWVTPLMQNNSCVDILSKDMTSATFEVVAIVDPLSASAQQISHLLSTIGHVVNADIRLCMNCKPKLSDIPLKRFLRVAIPTQLEFNQDGSLKRQPVARFSILPQKQLFTLNVIAPHSWLVEATEAAYDLDNIKMSDAFTDVVGIFELEHLLLEGHCFDEVTGSPPRGLQFTLGTAEQPVMFDTIVMANLGYFQLKANPGAWLLRLREGRSKEIYKVNSLDGSQVANDEDMVVILDSFGGRTVKIKVAKKPDKYEEELLPTSGEEDEESSLWQSISKKFTSPKDDYDVLNIFSLASGHLYERFLRIMMLSVLKHAKSPVKFWLLKNYLSPHFKAFLPFMAKRYNFSYELVQYKWPRWLHQQTVKQRVMWGYKILFLDVLFPLDVKKIIFVDADQVVRTNLMDLMRLDLEGAPYGYTPFCDSRKEMEGYRFWKSGYWKQHLGDRKYHISALYVVDLKRFRQIAAGDRLRGQYHGLSKDPNSLSNLDQSAMRIIEEWRDYDAEIKKLLDEYDRQRGIDRSASNEEEEEEEPQQPSGPIPHGEEL